MRRRLSFLKAFPLHARTLLFLGSVLLGQGVFAQGIGSFGDVYPITEPDFLTFIEQRLHQLEKSGQLAAWREDVTEHVRERALRPPPVEGLVLARENKTWLIDPSMTLSRDLTDEEGHVFAQKGTVFNPLSQVPLSRALLFFNGDDKAQVAWAQQEEQARAGKNQLILVGGSIDSTAELFHKAVSFDQAGRLTERFQIRSLPAKVTQLGLRLKVEEVAL